MTGAPSGSAGPVDPALVAARLAGVRQAIEAEGADPATITIVAVTKGFGEQAVRAAAAAGLRDIGENYAAELLAKAAATSELDPPLRWHAIGRLQRNKVGKLASTVALWQSIDRLALGRSVAQRRPGAPVLVQVNAGREATKGGCDPDQTPTLVRELSALGLHVGGLMTVAPAGSPVAATRAFELLRSQADDLGLRERSMGMSDDFRPAVRAGATMLRLGRALFGPRVIGADVRK